MDVSHIVVVVAVLTTVVGSGSGSKVDAGGTEPGRVAVVVVEQQEHELPQCLFHPPLLLPLLLPLLPSEHLHSPPLPQVLFPAGPSKPRLDQPLSSHSSLPPLPVPQVAWTRAAPKSMLIAYCDSLMVVVWVGEGKGDGGCRHTIECR